MKLIIMVFTCILTSIAFGCPKDSICTTDRVVDGSGGIGTVKAIFQNGIAVVEFESPANIKGKVLNRLATYLGKKVDCIKGRKENDVCGGMHAVDRSGRTGTIVEVFDNGLVSINIDLFGLPITMGVQEVSVEQICN